MTSTASSSAGSTLVAEGYISNTFKCKWKQSTLSFYQLSCTSAYASEKPNFVKLMQALKDELGDMEKLIMVSLPAFADFLVGEKILLKYWVCFLYIKFRTKLLHQLH
jgi:hypothetical protein